MGVRGGSACCSTGEPAPTANCDCNYTHGLLFMFINLTKALGV